MKEPEPVRFGDMAQYVKQILADAFGRVRELVIDLTDGLTDDIATYRPDPEANSIAWLLWHLGRGQDHQVAELAQVEQVWPQWRQRFGLPFDKWATGYGQGPEEVAAVRSGGLLGEYLGCSRADAALPGWHYCRRAGSDRGYPLGSLVTAAVRLGVIGGTMCMARLPMCAVWRSGGTRPH